MSYTTKKADLPTIKALETAILRAQKHLSTAIALSSQQAEQAQIQRGFDVREYLAKAFQSLMQADRHAQSVAPSTVLARRVIEATAIASMLDAQWVFTYTTEECSEEAGNEILRGFLWELRRKLDQAEAKLEALDVLFLYD